MNLLPSRDTSRRLPRLNAWTASAWYLAITLAMTWPLALGLARRLPVDLGDPLLNCWILQWDIDHFLRFLHGDWRALHGFWNANIFYPEPIALAYSEHLVAQALQALPLYAVTHDIVFCYNALFLSTFVLSGLGVFLLVRELTGSARAGFVAGLFYAFTPYRLSQFGHLQVLSSQWMPFALFALRRFFVSRAARPSGPGRTGHPTPAAVQAECASAGPNLRQAQRLAPLWPLSGAVLALVAENLSCGYFLVYFSPFVAAYVLWEIGSRRLWGDARTLVSLAAAAVVVAGLTLPFLLPYLELRQQGFSPRSLSEVMAYSADATTYLRATDGLWLWPGGFADPLSTEAVLFPGFTPVVLAVLALACLAVGLRRRVRASAPLRGWRLAVALPVALAGLAALELARFEMFAGRKIWRIRSAWPLLADVTHVLAIVGVAAAILLALSPRARAGARLALGSGRAFFASAALAAAWLSFGPQITTRQHGLSGETIYAWLYHHVPGFDGLRVPARFGMLVMLFLAVVAGYGLAVLGRAKEATGGASRWRAALPWAVAVFFLVESSGAPIRVASLEWPRRDGRPGVVSVDDLERLYAFIRRMPAGTVVAEFPFGNLHGETRAVFLSTRHGHPILNGYSGGFPARYDARKTLLQDPVGNGDPAWQALLDSGATCLVVHEWAFDDGNGPTLSRWLEAHGALPLATFKSDRLFQIVR